MYRILGIETTRKEKETTQVIILQDTETNRNYKVPITEDIKKDKDNILDYIETMLPIQKENIIWPKHITIPKIEK